MAELERILVAGGGIAGLCLAAALHRHGFEADVVERRSDWPAEGAAITMHANGVRGLRTLGFGAAVEAAAAVLPRWTFFDQHGDLLCETDLTDLWAGVGPCLGITRVRLQAILLTGSPGRWHRLGVAVTGLRPAGTKVVAAFSDGSEGEYDLVVGADGINSTVRRLALGAVEPEYAGTMSWRSVAPVRPEGVTHLMTFMGDGRFFGLVPVGDGHTYGFAGMDADRFDEPTEGRLERFRGLFGDFGDVGGIGGPVRAYLEALRSDEQLYVAPTEWVELDDWYAGRVVLVGDAAHAAPPHMGEGGSMAIEDAIVLAESLGTAETVEDALERYVARRRPRTDWVRDQSRAAAKAWVLPPAVRDAALRQRGDRMLRDRYQPLGRLP